MGEYSILHDKLRVLRIVFFAFIMCTLTAGVLVFAQEEGDPIRVGIFELPGFNEYDEAGNLRGYEIEYLESIANHTGWRFEYVKANSWPEALKMLEEGKIDMLSPSQKTKERMDLFDFPDYSFGTEYASILTLDTNYDLTFEDFELFSNIKFGCVTTLVTKDAFFDYARRNGFKTDVTYYKDTNALMSALRVGEIDAAVANLMNAKANVKVLAKFAPSDYYFMLNKNSSYLLNELNDTIAHIKAIHPSFESELTQKYFPFYNEIAFTLKELNYIEKESELLVGYITNREPISHTDPETGEFEGITRDILDRLSKRTGLKFKYIPLAEENINYDYLSKNKIRLVAGVEYNSEYVFASGIKLTAPYLITNKVLIGKEGSFDSNQKAGDKGDIKIAIASAGNKLNAAIYERWPDGSVLRYEKVLECLDAVAEGEADITIQNQYTAGRYLPKPKYGELHIIPDEGMIEEHMLAMISLQGGEEAEEAHLSDPLLLNILNKAISDLKEDELFEIIIQHTTNMPYKFTMGDFFYRYKFFIIIIAITIALMIAIGAKAYILKSKNAYILQLSEYKLKNITNNINGGVVVLLPNQGFKITYANEGFLSLIQYTQEEYEQQDSNYITYVHEEDIEILNQLAKGTFSVNEQVSLELRLLRKDGSYISTLFNGTLSEAQDGLRELYCVIMDISQQRRILEELEQEQVRYHLLIDKSNEMIFDININTRSINTSNNFRKNFGWELPKMLEEISVERILSIWFVHTEDRGILENSIKTVLFDMQDFECRVRLRTSDLTYRWCSISYNLIKKEDQVSRIIGRVIDIDNEIKEKEHLLRQSQTDSLSGLYNKEAFYTLGSDYLMNNKFKNSAVIFMDLDNFKRINDTFGHMAGDKAIVDAAKKLQIVFSQYDLLSRFGGDEFCILLKNIPMKTLCDKLAWTVEKMKEEYRNGEDSVFVSASMGVALSPLHGTDLSKLLLFADQALYSAKENGKTQFVIYNEGLELNGYHGRG